MKEPFSDNNVLLSLLFTLLIVFTLIFSFSNSQRKTLNPPMQWREAPISNPQPIDLN